jgi:hypothetical protein
MQKFKEAFAADLREVIVKYREQVWTRAKEDLLDITNDISSVIQAETFGLFSVTLKSSPLSEDGEDVQMLLNRTEPGKDVVQVGMINHYHLKKDGSYPLFFLAPQRTQIAPPVKVQIDNRENLIAITVLAFREPRSEIINQLANWKGWTTCEKNKEIEE